MALHAGSYHSIVQPYVWLMLKNTLCRASSLRPARLRITATMERMAWRSSMKSERGVVLRRALSQTRLVFSIAFDSSQAQRLQNQSVYAEVVCPLCLYR
jgi:hypothetical protein